MLDRNIIVHDNNTQRLKALGEQLELEKQALEVHDWSDQVNWSDKMDDLRDDVREEYYNNQFRKIYGISAFGEPVETWFNSEEELNKAWSVFLKLLEENDSKEASNFVMVVSELAQ